MKGKILHVEKTNDPLKGEEFDNVDKYKSIVGKDIKNNKKKKKKRKLESNETAAEPEKKIKIEEVKSTIEENNIVTDKKDEYETSDNEDMQEIKISKEESDKFNGKFLRNSFNSAAGYSTLQKFIMICNQHDKDLAAEYIQAGGSVLEILRLLDASEKRNIHNIATVFSAMHIVIMKILAQYPQNQSSAEEACRHLINSHLASIHSMLSSQGKAKHRKIVLKLLAAIVSLGGSLPRELLNHLSLHSQLLDVLVSHSKPTDPQSVRTCFIHFILAFLVEGNASDIRALLEKRGVLSSIFSGLVYDYSDLVQLVLTTVKKYVLENPVITKTIKLHVFSTPVVQQIVNLYNWKGPKNWPGHKKQKLLSENIDSEQKKVTVNAVHEFLIILLTSNRHGIAFHDRTLGSDSGKKHNQLISTILQSLDKPWEHEKPSELVVKILTACPDLIRSQLSYTEPFLIPRISKKWVAVIQFIKKIISDIDVESCLKLCSIDMTTLQLANAVLNLTVPTIIIKNAITPALCHESSFIHCEIISLLLAMIKKLENFIKSFENMKFNASESSIFRNIIVESLIKHMPNFETILHVWTQSFGSQLEKQICDLKEKDDLHLNIKSHLLAILNLLEAYSEICPEILLTSNTINAKAQHTALLTRLCDVKNINEEELTRMKVKAMKILLFSNISTFSPNEEIFGVALPFLITKVGCKDVSLDVEVRQTINLLLNGCGLFEGFNDQIDIWIDSVIYLENDEDKLEVANWIAKIINRVSKHTEKYLSLIHKTEENTGDEIVDINKYEDIFKDLSERNIEDKKRIAPMLPVTSISLLSYAGIENIKKNSTDALAHYMSIVLTHTLHCQISSETFISLIEDLNIPAQKYLKSWSHNNLPIPMRKPYPMKNIFRVVSRILLDSKIIWKVNVEGKQLCIEVDDSIDNYTLTHFEVKALLRMIIFYLSQLLKKSNANHESTSGLTQFLLSILKVAKEVELDCEYLLADCAKLIFNHPIILQYFKGIYKNKNSPEYIITTLLIKVCTVYFDFGKQHLLVHLMQPYQEKFIMQIKSNVKKYKKTEMKKEIKAEIELIEILQLNIEKVADLISTIMTLPKEKFLTLDKSKLSIWGNIIPKLLNQFSSEKSQNKLDSFVTIQENLLKKLFYYLIEFKITYKQKTNVWEHSLYEYLLKFQHSISVIDEKIFGSLIKSEITLETVKMINLLTTRSPKFITTLIKCVNDNEEILQQNCLVFSILSSNLKHKWDQEFLEKIYKLYKKDIFQFLTKPKSDDFSWIRENIEAIVLLIEKTFDENFCKQVCETILSNGDKLDTAQEEHIKLFQIIFKKCLGFKPDALKDFVQVLLHITVTALKKDSKNIIKLNFFCKTLVDCITNLKINDNFTFEELNKNYSWPQFARINLKSGLKITKENKNKTSFLLKALVVACDVAYKDNSNEEYVKTIFEMTTSHSEFINIMLSDASIKSDLVELLWTLVRKNHEIMLVTHVPLYLASYTATLTISDQFILKILQHYESNGIKLDSYKPYLWGSAAATHYSVKGTTDTALWRQPSTSQVLDLLVPETVANTITNFPIKRNWKCDCTNVTNTVDQVYDPAFYLPVFTHLLAENNIIACHKVIHSGALALTIIACSSTCEQVRLAAFTVISRFYFHLEATSSKEKLLWIHFIDTLRNGIANTESPLENVQLNGFVATFLARTCLVMIQPLNPLYAPLQAFLMAKPALDLNTIPELLQLYHSSEIEHYAHRHWILEVIRDGLRNENDMDVVLKCVLFKMILNFYHSTLSDKVTKNLILQIVRSSTRLSKPCMILVNGYAILPWLISVAKSLNRGDVESIVYIVNIVNNILNILREMKSKETYHYVMLIKALLCLKDYFNQNLKVEHYKTFINTLNKTIINNIVCHVLTKHHIKDLINFSKLLLENVNECELMLQYGCKFIKMKYFDVDNDSTLRESLCKLIITWCNYNQNSK